MSDHSQKSIKCYAWTILNAESSELVGWSYQVGKTSVCIEPPVGGIPRVEHKFKQGKHIAPIREVIGFQNYDGGITEITPEITRSYIERGLRTTIADLMYSLDGMSEGEWESKQDSERQAHLDAGGCPGCSSEVAGPEGIHKLGCSVHGRGSSMFTSGIPARQLPDGSFELVGIAKESSTED